MILHTLLGHWTKIVSNRTSATIFAKPQKTCAFYSKHAKIEQPLLEKNISSFSQYTQKDRQSFKNKKRWKVVLPVFGFLTLSVFGIPLFVILGGPELDPEGNPLEDDVSKESVVMQYMIRTSREVKYYFQLLQAPKIEKLLPDPLDPPYNQPKYTLVIELNGVMVHPEWTYSSGWRYKKRPLLDRFLEDLKDSYEIVLYTSEHGGTVFSLMDIIDPNNAIAYKLVRGTTRFTGFGHVKKLNNLNRDLKRVICVDWNARHVKYNPDNLLKVKKWSGRDDDTSLLDLTAFLKTITDNQIDDVREVLKYYRKYNDPVEAFRRKQEMLIEELEEKAAKQNEPHQRSHQGFKLFH